MYLTAKPYTEPELSALLLAVASLKQAAFPKSQLYRLREQLTKGWLASTVDYLYLQARSQQAETLRRVLDASWIGYERHGHTASTGVWLRRDTPPASQRGKRSWVMWQNSMTLCPLEARLMARKPVNIALTLVFRRPPVSRQQELSAALQIGWSSATHGGSSSFLVRR